MRSKRFKSKFKNVLIVHRPSSDPAFALGREVATWLSDKGIRAYSHPRQMLGPKWPKITETTKKKLDLVVVVGGDGTYLEAVRFLRTAQVPILGVNMGALGFLTAIRADQVFQALEQTLAGEMESRCRSLLNVEIRAKNKILHQGAALNDIVIERGPQSQLIHISTFADGSLVGPVKADGLIVSTPTGSTAYNLAAGGPILHPEVAGIVLTPICAHSLTNRPFIFPDHMDLHFRLNEGSSSAILTVDGRKFGEVQRGQEVWIKKARHGHLVLRQPKDSYFALLREKLKFGDRA